MGMSEIAQSALEKALEVYRGLERLSAIVDQIQERVTDFRDETRKRLTDFEQRLDNKANNIEARSDRKIEELEARASRKVDDLERRMRELETGLSKLAGKTDGALAEAYKAVLQQALERGLPKDGKAE
jgi:hypothetical protein